MSAILSPFKKIYDLIDGFVLIMLTAIGIALLAPELGTGDGPLHLGTVTNLGVALVFFPARRSPLARRRWWRALARHRRLHAFVQCRASPMIPSSRWSGWAPDVRPAQRAARRTAAGRCSTCARCRRLFPPRWR
ncbi:bile acid:sodium symporter [Cupriavidus basilensis]